MYHQRLGESYLEKEKPNLSLAQSHLERAVALEDRLYRAHYMLGRVYDQKGEGRAAAERWTKSASMAPTSFGKPFNALGKLYIRWDMLSQAMAVLQVGIARVTDRDDAADLYYHLGLTLSNQNKPDHFYWISYGTIPSPGKR